MRFWPTHMCTSERGPHDRPQPPLHCRCLAPRCPSPMGCRAGRDAMTSRSVRVTSGFPLGRNVLATPLAGVGGEANRHSISSSARAVSLRIAAAGRDAGVPSTGVPVPTFDNDQMYAGGLRVGRSHCGCHRHAPARVRPYRQDWSAFAGRAGLFHGRCSSLLTGRGRHASGLFPIFGSQPRRQAIADLPPSVHFKAPSRYGNHPSERLHNEIHELHGPENDN